MSACRSLLMRFSRIYIELQTVTSYCRSFDLCSSSVLPLPLKSLPYFTQVRSCSKEPSDPRKMVDPKRVLSYEDVLKVISQPEKVLIDVRNPEEVNSTGKIPSSINIPLGNVQNALTSMSEEEFKQQYQRKKPNSEDELIFYCQSGKRSSEALNKALQLGYSNSKTYLGSWNEWSNKNK